VKSTKTQRGRQLTATDRAARLAAKVKRVQAIADAAMVRQRVGLDAIHQRTGDGGHAVVVRSQTFTGPDLDTVIANACAGRGAP
jgi:hypothetical protein